MAVALNFPTAPTRSAISAVVPAPQVTMAQVTLDAPTSMSVWLITEIVASEPAPTLLEAESAALARLALSLPGLNALTLMSASTRLTPATTL